MEPIAMLSSEHMQANDVQASDVPTQEGKSKTFKWPTYISRFFIEFMAEQARNGLKCDKGFKPQAISAVIRELNKRYTKSGITERNVRNHLRTLTNRVKLINTLKATSGWVWDEDKKMIKMGKEEYDTYVEAHKSHEPYLMKPIEQYEDLCLIVGSDHATGAWMKDTSQSLGQPIDKNSSQFAPIDVDNIASEEIQPSLNRTFNLVKDGVEFTDSSQVQSKNSTQGVQMKLASLNDKGKRKRKERDIYAYMDKMTVAVDNVASAMTEDLILKFTTKLYEEIMSLPGYSDEVKSAAYEHLLQTGNEYKARGFLSRSIDLQHKWMDEFLLGNPRGMRMSTGLYGGIGGDFNNTIYGGIHEFGGATSGNQSNVRRGGQAQGLDHNANISEEHARDGSTSNETDEFSLYGD